jgi:LysM repeat protein
MRALVFIFSFLFVVAAFGQNNPERFLTHKVKKKETLYGLSRKYNVSIEQIKEFNPLIEKIGLKKRMQIKIPVYPIIEAPKAVPLKEGLEKYLVQPKETKWRLAYRYGITIQELEQLNPQIKDGLKIGQEIVIPKRTAEETKALEEAFNYYKVKPKEGFYRLEKKLGVTEADLISLNPTLPETGLQEGMILKIGLQNTGDLKVEDDLLIEKVRLEDSVLTNTDIKLVAFLPFKSASIEFDSIEKTTALLKKRNLHTIALDFYMGMVLAVEKADALGISVALNVLDSQNKKQSISEQVEAIDWSGVQGLIGPLITANFDYAAQLPVLKNVPMVSPLSSKKINQAKHVYQSVSPLASLRNKMVAYLDKIIDTTQNVMIIADTLNAAFAKGFEEKYPYAHRVRPEEGGFVLPDLIDSLLIDSLPNKLVFESQDLNLAANVISLLNSQVSKERDVQLFTTLRTSIYENDNISRKHLGNLRFTYLSGNHPMKSERRTLFKNTYQKRFGDFPSKEAFRAYDLTLDIILRLAYKEEIYLPSIGETDYLENRFFHEKASQAGYQNVGFYLLQHQGYDIIEIKK